MKKNTLTLLCAAFLCLTPLFAERIVFQADSMTGNTGKKNEYTKLSGSASVVTETMEISADTIELSGKDFRNIKATVRTSVPRRVPVWMSFWRKCFWKPRCST